MSAKHEVTLLASEAQIWSAAASWAYMGTRLCPDTPRSAISFSCSTSRFPLQADAKMICASFFRVRPHRKLWRARLARVSQFVIGVLEL